MTQVKSDTFEVITLRVKPYFTTKVCFLLCHRSSLIRYYILRCLGRIFLFFGGLHFSVYDVIVPNVICTHTHLSPTPLWKQRTVQLAPLPFVLSDFINFHSPTFLFGQNLNPFCPHTTVVSQSKKNTYTNSKPNPYSNISLLGLFIDLYTLGLTHVESNYVFLVKKCERLQNYV